MSLPSPMINQKKFNDKDNTEKTCFYTFRLIWLRIIGEGSQTGTRALLILSVFKRRHVQMYTT